MAFPTSSPWYGESLILIRSSEQPKSPWKLAAGEVCWRLTWVVVEDQRDDPHPLLHGVTEQVVVLRGRVYVYFCAQMVLRLPVVLVAPSPHRPIQSSSSSSLFVFSREQVSQTSPEDSSFLGVVGSALTVLEQDSSFLGAIGSALTDLEQDSPFLEVIGSALTDLEQPTHGMRGVCRSSSIVCSRSFVLDINFALYWGFMSHNLVGNTKSTVIIIAFSDGKVRLITYCVDKWFRQNVNLIYRKLSIGIL